MAEKPRPYGAKRNAGYERYRHRRHGEKRPQIRRRYHRSQNADKSTLNQQIDAAVDTALTDILGSDADNTVMQ